MPGCFPEQGQPCAVVGADRGDTPNACRPRHRTPRCRRRTPQLLRSGQSTTVLDVGGAGRVQSPPESGPTRRRRTDCAEKPGGGSHWEPNGVVGSRSLPGYRYGRIGYCNTELSKNGCDPAGRPVREPRASDPGRRGTELMPLPVDHGGSHVIERDHSAPNGRTAYRGVTPGRL